MKPFPWRIQLMLPGALESIFPRFLIFTGWTFGQKARLRQAGSFRVFSISMFTILTDIPMTASLAAAGSAGREAAFSFQATIGSQAATLCRLVIALSGLTTAFYREDGCVILVPAQIWR